MSQKSKGIIGILTGGGDVPGLNPAHSCSNYQSSQRRI